ncbi:hypothetical protein ACR957_23205 [Klebsiella pneumoniae]
MKSSIFSNFFRSSLPVILLTAFMSPVSFASSFDEPANDKFESSDLRGLNHLTDLINERNTTSEKISEHNVLNKSQEELTNKISVQLKHKLEQEKIDQLISSLNKNNSSSEELNSSIQHLISILESQKQSHDGKRTAITVLTNGGYLVGSTMRHGSSSLTRFTGQSAMTSRIW